MSGYRDWYWLTVLRWASPRISATSRASIRSSTETLRDTQGAYASQQMELSPVSSSVWPVV